MTYPAGPSRPHIYYGPTPIVTPYISCYRFNSSSFESCPTGSDGSKVNLLWLGSQPTDSRSASFDDERDNFLGLGHDPCVNGDAMLREYKDRCHLEGRTFTYLHRRSSSPHTHHLKHITWRLSLSWRVRRPNRGDFAS